MRNVGVSTLVAITALSVASPIAPSHTSEFGAWPVEWRHGWK